MQRQPRPQGDPGEPGPVGPSAPTSSSERFKYVRGTKGTVVCAGVLIIPAELVLPENNIYIKEEECVSC